MRTIAAAFLVAAHMLSPSTKGTTLVRDGKPEAAIVLGEKATRSAQMGAFELQHHVRLITGAELPITRGAPPVGKTSIRIGGNNAGLHHETSRVAITDSGILLTGNDTPDSRTVDYGNPVTFPQTDSEFKGSLFAVYDFLEKESGVRFYAPGRFGTAYRERKTLVVEPVDRQYSPPLDAFREVYDDDRTYAKRKHSPRERSLWRLRWRLSVFFGRTNHNMYSIYFAHWDQAKRDKTLAETFVGKRHEFFAAGYEGAHAPTDSILRNNYPGDPDLPPQLCYSNPGTVEYYAKEVVTYFDGHNVRGGWKNFSGRWPTDQTSLPLFPGKPHFYPIQGGDTGGYCHCATCLQRFLGQPEGERVANRKFQFIADVARQAAKIRPGAGVSTLAYISTLPYPKGVDLPDNVSVQLCLTHYAWYHPGIRAYQEDVYKEWIAKEGRKRPVTLWTYIFSPHWAAKHHFANYNSFPGLYPWKTGELFKRFTGDGIRGWFTEVEMQYNALEAYVAARICFDPSVDPDRVISEYFQNYYGAAGDAMQAFYREVEGAYWNWDNYPVAWRESTEVLGPRGKKDPAWGTGLHSPDVNWAIGNPERMAKLNALIEQAKTLVKTPAEKARLAQFIDGIWEGALTGRRQYEVIQKRKEEPAPAWTATRIANAAGDVTKIDWEKVTACAEWRTADGAATQRDMTFRTAADDSHLYLDFHEAAAPGESQDIWRNNVEVFFAAGPSLPVLQLALAPSGQLVQLRHEQTNDAPKMTKVDAGAVIDVRSDKDSWGFRLAIPRRTLPKPRTGPGMTFNIMRTTHSRRPAAMWSPIYCAAYLKGIDAFGQLFWPEFALEDDSFRLYQKGSLSDIVPDRAAADGHAAAMNGNSSWAIQCPVPRSFDSATSYRVALMMRSDATPDDTLSSHIGVYDRVAKKVIKSVAIPSSRISGTRYQEVELGTMKLTPSMYIYVGGFSRKSEAAKIYLDRVIFAKR